MKLQDNIQIKGEVSFTITDKDGKVRTHTQPNLITNEGMEYLVSKLLGKNEKLYAQIGQPTWSTLATTADKTNYHIQEIAIGTDITIAAKTQTWDTLKSVGKKLKKSITNLEMDNTIAGLGSWFYQCTFDSQAADTLITNGNEEAIKEVMLLAKYGDYDSPQESVVDSRIIISRTVLQQPFIKYTTDKVAISWKLKLG
tara:strand:+ start:4512 stop:5105 length:594 start_codon:yes stop_codon:yes gene_type:complete